MGKWVAALLVLGAASGSVFASAKPPPKETNSVQPSAPGSTEPGATEAAPTSSSQAAAAPAEAEATVIMATATVVRIDKAGRKLTLLGPDGQWFDVKTGPNVDLDTVRVGDRVNATYYEEVAVGINRHPHGGARVATRTVQRGGVTARQATVTARILGVDTADDTVFVRTPDGRTHNVKVADPALRAELPKIRAGEDVDLTYTQAVAVEVEPATEPMPSSEQPVQPAPPVQPTQPARPARPAPPEQPALPPE
jgi:hypothetical protein